MTSWEEKRAHQLARLDRMQLDLEETSDPGAPDTIRRMQRIEELRDLSLALSPREWEASRDVPDNIPWSPTPPGAS